jgi:tetratricopeptide (TPR) repeat protein
MLTIIKRGLNFKALWVIAAAAVLLTGCDPPGTRSLLKGQRLLNAGKYPEAVAKLEEAVGLLADAPPTVQAQALDWLGVARQYAGQPKEALDAYSKALKLDRNQAPAAYNLGCLYLEHGNYRAAIDQLNTCLALSRSVEIKDADIYLKIGLAYLRMTGQTSGSEKTRHFDSARRYLDAVHKLAPSPEELNATGLILLQRNRSANEAINRFKEALRLDPNYAPAILNMAVVHHYYLNDPHMALQGYRHYMATPDNPQWPKPVPAKEIETLVQGLERQLSPAFTPAAQIQPSAVAKPAVINVAPAPMPKPPSAKPEINTAQHTITNPPALRASVLPTNAPGITHIPEAAKPASTQNRYRYVGSTTLVSGNHNEALHLVSHGFTAQQTNKNEAMTYFRRAIKTDPRCFDAYYLLGGVARESGNLPVALDALERAVSLKPESPDARYAFAWTLSKAKFPQDCADELEKLLKQTPNETRAHLLLANTCAMELGQTRLAREHYQRVIKLEPNHPQAESIRNWLKATESP